MFFSFYWVKLMCCCIPYSEDNMFPTKKGMAGDRNRMDGLVKILISKGSYTQCSGGKIGEWNLGI